MTLPDAVGVAGAAWALAAAWWAPGAAVVTWLGLGRDALERLALSLAVGFAVFATASLALASTVGAAWIPVGSLAGAAAWAAARRGRGPAARRGRGPAAPRGRGPAVGAGREVAPVVAAALAAALLLAVAVVARNGLADAAGTLTFFGRDASNDPLVYASLALQLHETGLPLAYPFAGGAPTTSSYLPYGAMIGLHAFGVPMLDVVFRWLPVASGVALGVGAGAWARRLGDGTGAAALAAGLVLLAGDPGPWLAALGARPFDSWALFGPYLLAFNPATAAMALAFAALLLAADPRARPAASAVAGLLVAATFETKVFVWAPLFAGLVGVALVRPPAGRSAALRRTAAMAAAASAPFVVEKLLWARALAGREATRFELCPGCLPRYLADASVGSGEVAFRAFDAFAPGQLLDPGWWATTVPASLLALGVALGARALAIPALWRGAFATADPGAAAACRWLGVASALGLGAAWALTTAPHHLNGAQLAWVATVGLWPAVAVVAVRAGGARRLAVLAFVAVLAAPGTWHALVRLGADAAPAARVSRAERELLDALRAHTRPGDVILEPSTLLNPDFPSPVAWWSGRSTYLSLLSASQLLPEAALHRRFARVGTAFTATEPAAGRAAVAASGADWVYAPRAWPLRFDPGPALAVVERTEAGTLYRVAAPREGVAGAP